jgi:hypothetical protein
LVNLNEQKYLLTGYGSADAVQITTHVLLISVIVLCCPIMFFYGLNSVLGCPIQFPHKNDAVRLYLQWLVGGLMSYLRYLFVSHSGVQHILCCVFVKKHNRTTQNNNRDQQRGPYNTGMNSGVREG